VADLGDALPAGPPVGRDKRGIGTGTAYDDQMDPTRLIICGVVPDPRHHGRSGPSTMSHPRQTKHRTSALRQDPDASRAEDKARAFVTG
jgi:hypothetical protein